MIVPSNFFSQMIQICLVCIVYKSGDDFFVFLYSRRKNVYFFIIMATFFEFKEIRQIQCVQHLFFFVFKFKETFLWNRPFISFQILGTEQRMIGLSVTEQRNFLELQLCINVESKAWKLKTKRQTFAVVHTNIKISRKLKICF